MTADTATPLSAGAGVTAPEPGDALLPPEFRDAAQQARALIRSVTAGAVATPEDRLARAQRVSKLAVEVLKGDRFSVVIRSRSGPSRRHVTVDGWTTLGTLCGFVFGDPVLPHVTGCRRVDGGWEASAEARTGSGLVLAAAEAQCTTTEQNWRTAEDHAVRSMAQTRACGKAMRLSLAWVLGLSHGDYALTPAEEMPGAGQPEEEA